MPAAYREAVDLLRESDEARRRSATTLARYEARTLPWGLVLVVSWLPAVIVVGGIVSAAAFEFAVHRQVDVPVFLAESVWGPVIVAAGLVTLVFWYSTYLSGWVPGAKAALAAKPPAAEGAPPVCRSCGAPLAVRAGDTFARCIYCGADNLVMLDAIHARSLATSVEHAEADAAQAIAHFRARGSKASTSALAILGFWVAFAALPLLWSLGGKGFRTSGWAFATGLASTPLILFSMMMSFTSQAFGNPAHTGSSRSPRNPAGEASTPSSLVIPLGMLAVLVVLGLFFAILYAEAP